METIENTTVGSHAWVHQLAKGIIGVAVGLVAAKGIDAAYNKAVLHDGATTTTE